MTTESSTNEVEMLNSSRLGTQEYWEGLYQKENQNYEHHGKGFAKIIYSKGIFFANYSRSVLFICLRTSIFEMKEKFGLARTLCTE